MKFKTHQLYALIFMAGLLFGAGLHYYMFSKTVSYKVERAYDEGVSFGKEVQLKTILNSFQTSDSACITKDQIIFYTFDR